MPTWGYAVIAVFLLMLIWPSTGGVVLRRLRRARRKARARRRARQDARHVRGRSPPRAT